MWAGQATLAPQRLSILIWKMDFYKTQRGDTWQWCLANCKVRLAWEIERKGQIMWQDRTDQETGERWDLGKVPWALKPRVLLCQPLTAGP